MTFDPIRGAISAQWVGGQLIDQWHDRWVGLAGIAELIGGEIVSVTVSNACAQ